MAKPKTTYTPTSKSPASFTKVAKNANTFNPTGSTVLSWLLNSTVVTLNSTLHLLSGFTTASPTTPPQLNNKNPITYTAV